MSAPMLRRGPDIDRFITGTLGRVGLARHGYMSGHADWVRRDRLTNPPRGAIQQHVVRLSAR